MGKIFYLMGKSSSGKDTIYKKILEQSNRKLLTVVPYTTRPIREGETEGIEYHFTDETGYEDLLAKGKVIESRSYHTCHGLWRYFTVINEDIADNARNYLMIGTLESYIKTRDYFGKDKIIPVFIELDDGVRLERALERERHQPSPKYEEMCRRFLADSEDFSEEKMEKAGITRRFYNDDLTSCLLEIITYIEQQLS